MSKNAAERVWDEAMEYREANGWTEHNPYRSVDMTGQVIPDAAVEAAAEVAHRGLHGDALGEYGDSYQCEYKGTIRAALEAAAPHMLAALRPYTLEDQRKHGETW